MTARENQSLLLRYRERLSGSPESPIVYMFHGRAGNLSSMWVFEKVIPVSYSIVSPEGPIPDDLGGFSWWKVGQATTYEKKKSIAGGVSEFIERYEAQNHLHPDARLAVGFSMGSGLLGLLLQMPELHFDGIAMIAGFKVEPDGGAEAEGAKRMEQLEKGEYVSEIVMTRPTKVSRNMATRDELPNLKTKLFIAHGLKDRIVPVDGTRAWVTELQADGYEVEYHEDSVGHKIGSSGMRQLGDWMKGFDPLASVGLGTEKTQQRG